jgi:hypothetical protein
MPTIPQLPPATETTAQDEIPLSQAGITRSVTISELLASVQTAIEIPSGTLLGRVSLGPGGPEPVYVSTGLALQSESLLANGGDHAGFVAQTALALTDDVIVNASGTPSRLAMPLLRRLFNAGTNVAIDANGDISASTDPSVTSQLQSLTSGLTSTEAQVTALSAKIPIGGYAALNSQGQVTAPLAGSATLATVTVASGAPARTLGAMSLDTVNVLDFGAVTGGADCTAAFGAAFASLGGGGEIFVPAGDYWFASSLVLSGKAVTLRGAGRGQTRLHFSHTGIGLDFVPGNIFNKIVLRDFSGYAESSAGQTAALARITFPNSGGFGYVTASICEVECFGYPNSANGTSPFPQSFLRGFVLNNCWSAQLNNISWFGPPAAAGATTSAFVELNESVDTRIHGAQAYYGNSFVLQTGYCEGIYITSPLVVGVDYLFSQTNETQWPGYVANKPLLLGLWVANGEVNTNLGTVQAANVTDGFFVGMDITRDSGPNTAQTFFNLTNCSNFHIMGCNFVGGPTGGSGQDIAFGFQSTWNSSGNVIGLCHFENMATVIKITGSNGTVGLTTYGLNLGNVPISTAVIDNTPQENANFVSFVTPAATGVPAGIANTHDHVFTNSTGNILFRINSTPSAANFIRHQPATTTNPPTLCFDGSDTTVGGVIQTKGGSFYVNAAGGSGGSGNLLSLLNTPNAANWVVVQNATAGNLSLLKTNAGGLGIEPAGALWLAPSGGLFAPGLPTTKPAAGSNQIWNNGGVLSIA